MKRYVVKLYGDGWGKTVKEDAEDLKELMALLEEKYKVGKGKVGCNIDLTLAEEV